MKISWNGFASFTIKGKPIEGEVTLVTDPYDNSTGLRFPRTLAASIVAKSSDNDCADNVDSIGGEGERKEPFIVHHAGEYEVSGIFVNGISAPKKDGTSHSIFKIHLEGINIAFLGALDRKLTEDEQSALGNIDILILPVGGKSVLDANKAAEVVAQVEPRIIIPSFIYVKGAKEKFATADEFCKEVACSSEEVNSAKITKSSLPIDEMQILILSRT